jgi:hypothetical protein
MSDRKHLHFAGDDEFAGVILDPEARRLRYLLLMVAGLFKHRRYLVPIDPTQIDAEHRSLRVGIERAALAACTIFDSKTI